MLIVGSTSGRRLVENWLRTDSALPAKDLLHGLLLTTYLW